MLWNRTPGVVAVQAPGAAGAACRPTVLMRDNRGMAAPPGRRRATRTPPRSRSLLLLLGALLGACAGWVLLVAAAIDLGRQARGGEPLAWVFLAVGTVGAVACLLLVLVVGARLLTLLGLLDAYRPRRARRR